MTHRTSAAMRAVEPLSWRQVIAYGFGDMANNFAFAMGAMFLLSYYTDVAGIGAAAAGTLLVVVRIYSALMDMVAGWLIDHTSTRWGRFRPFLLWGAVPLMLSSVAVFSVPSGWSATGKLMFAYASYALLVTAYAFVNIPYGSLATAMTQEPRERARLGASRVVMASCTVTFLAIVLGPAVASVHGEALQQRLTQFTLVLGAVGVLLYGVCFRSTREIVTRDIEHPPFRDSLATLLSNRPLMILCAAAMCVLVGVFSMNASIMYFARYVLGDARQFAVLIAITYLFGTLVSAPLAPMLVHRVGKKNTFLLAQALAVLGSLAIFFTFSSGRMWVYASFGLASIGIMLAMVVMWALEADTVEYGEWRTGVRIEGLTYSVFSFSRKCGQALGGSIPAFLLAGSAYVPNAQVQESAALLGILQGVSLVPAIAFSCAFILTIFYPLTDARFLALVHEIESHRAR